jgi:competence protein ComEA
MAVEEAHDASSSRRAGRAQGGSTMTRIAALLIAVAFAVGLLGAPAPWAQTTTAPPAKPAAKDAAKDGKKAADDTKKAGKAEPVDINTASAEELQKIPGIGDAYSKKIIDSRPYARKDDLVKKKVLPEAVYNKVKDQIVAKQK